MTDSTAPTLRRLRLADATDAERRALTDRASTATPDIRARARAIVDAVRTGGDAALREANARFGGGLTEPADAPALRVPTDDLRAARDRLPAELRAGLEQMATQHRGLPRDRGPAPGAVGGDGAGRGRSVACGAAWTAWRRTSPAAPPPTLRRC